jgi:predicted nucleic acid-binding protein
MGETALARWLRLATHNINHFQRIPGLVVVDWTE